MPMMNVEDTPYMQQQVGSLFIYTPGIEECRNYWVVQKLIEHRIRCLLTEQPFTDTSRELVVQYLTPPPTAVTAEDVNKFIEYEAAELMNMFSLYEQTPEYQDCLQALVPYKGKPFSVTSVTMTGIQILINL